MRELFKKTLLHRSSKFITAGGATVGTEYATFGLLILLGTPLLAANTISFCCGLLVSYHLNRRWVFGSVGGRKRFGAYVVLAMVNLLLSNIIVYSTHNMGLSEFIAKLVAMVIIAGSNYVIYSRFLFKY